MKCLYLAYCCDIQIIVSFRVKAVAELSHVLTIMNSAVQDGETALERASIHGHQKVVELLLGAGANPDLHDKVKVEHVHANLSNGKWCHTACEALKPLL